MISICAKYMAPAFREARSRDEILSSFHVQNTSQRARTGEILDGVHVGNVLRSETRLCQGNGVNSQKGLRSRPCMVFPGKGCLAITPIDTFRYCSHPLTARPVGLKPGRPFGP